jgi:putative ABC transport system permease protein
MLIPKLAARNLVRNVRRTVITSASVVFGVAIQVLGWGLVDGLDENFLRAARTTYAGDVLLRPDGYDLEGTSFPLDEAEVPPDALVAQLDAAGPWTSRALIPSRFVKGADGARGVVIGYEAERETTVFNRAEWKLDGRWPGPGAEEITVGYAFARLVGLATGDSVVAEARTADGAINALTYTVVGLVRTDNAQLDNVAAWMEMGAAERLGRLEGRRTHLAVLADAGTPDEIAQAATGTGWNAQTLLQETDDMLAINRFRRKAIGFLVFIVMAIAGTGIANTIVMATYERTREIGTLVALGMRRGQVRTLFLAEGAVLGTVAGILGGLLGAFWVHHWQIRGIHIGEDVMNASSGFPVGSVIYTVLKWPMVALSASFGTAVALVASLWPAHVAANLVPADAVRAD